MMHLYIAGGCLIAAGLLYLMGRNHGKKREQQKQTEWANKHFEEQQKKSNKTGVRNAKIDGMSTDDLAKRSSKWVRD